MIYCQLWMLVIDTVSTCFGHLYAHLQEKRPRVTAYGVYLPANTLHIYTVASCWYSFLTLYSRCTVTGT